MGPLNVPSGRDLIVAAIVLVAASLIIGAVIGGGCTLLAR